MVVEEEEEVGAEVEDMGRVGRLGRWMMLGGRSVRVVRARGFGSGGKRGSLTWLAGWVDCMRMGWGMKMHFCAL